ALAADAAQAAGRAGGADPDRLDHGRHRARGHHAHARGPQGQQDRRRRGARHLAAVDLQQIGGVGDSARLVIHYAGRGFIPVSLIPTLSSSPIASGIADKSITSARSWPSSAAVLNTGRNAGTYTAIACSAQPIANDSHNILLVNSPSSKIDRVELRQLS